MSGQAERAVTITSQLMKKSKRGEREQLRLTRLQLPMEVVLFNVEHECQRGRLLVYPMTGRLDLVSCFYV